MPLDPRRLKPKELVALLNATPLGDVTNERQMRRHRERAGLAIGEGGTVDLLRYVAWLVHQRHSRRSASRVDVAAGYEAHKEQALARSAAQSREGRDIGPIPDVADPARRAATAASLRVWCETYFPATFHLAWSADHLKAIERIEEVARDGGCYALAMPRGSGKSSLCEAALLWAAFTLGAEMVGLIAATAHDAIEILAGLKTELETNELLLADWPEVVYPVHCLEGIANRCKGQHVAGKPTAIRWEKRTIVLPTVEGSRASGVIIRTAGLTGAIRGMRYKRRDGRQVRPRLVLVDDPQTDRSAKSELQTGERETVLTGCVAGLPAPGVKLGLLMACTVIRPKDLAHRFLDRATHPAFRGERFQMLYAMPSNLELWDEYARLRSESFRGGGNGSEATEFYRAHQAAMDASAIVAWPERHNDDELSGIQHAMNRWLDDPRAFAAECQNDPLVDGPSDDDLPTVEGLLQRCNGLPRGRVPGFATHVASMVDVQKLSLWYVVAAFGPGLGGAVIDYGVWPSQDVGYFTKGTLRITLAQRYPGQAFEGYLQAGLTDLTELLLGREWQRDDRRRQPIDRCLVDSKWGKSTETVKHFCRTSRHSARLTPSQGLGITAAKQPMSEYRRRPGERIGPHWIYGPLPNARSLRGLRIDVNWWKSTVAERLRLPPGHRGAITLFGDAKTDHRLLADHLTSESRVRTEGRGREVDQWELKPGRPDNDWWDGLIGCAVGASLAGCEMDGLPDTSPRPRLKLSDIQARKQSQQKGRAA